MLPQPGDGVPVVGSRGPRLSALALKLYVFLLLLVVVWGILLACSFIFWSMGVVPACPASRKRFSQRPFPPEGACDRHPANQLRGGALRPVLSPEALLPPRTSCKSLEANVIARVRARSMSRRSLGPPKGFPLRGKSKYKKIILKYKFYIFCIHIYT